MSISQQHGLPRLDPSGVAASFWRHDALVLTAAPGAGKTTAVPRALLEEAKRRDGQIWVIEPRRLAARLAATYVAQQLSEAPGETVGFWVRDMRCVGPRTRLIYMTEGMLWRLMLSRSPAAYALADVAALVFDEFHNRSMASDVALGVALLVRAQITQRTHRLALMVMSATLDAQAVAKTLGGAPVIEVGGRQHPVEKTFLSHASRAPLSETVVSVLPNFLAQGTVQPSHHDCLVFLPGVAEIEATRQRLLRHALSATYDVVPLHARLAPAEQDGVVRFAHRPRIILSTNIAETSITLPQVGRVLDGTLARVPRADGITGWVRLGTEPISQASMAQRAGRAGRTGPGHCLHLLTAQQFAQRPSFDVPELMRLPVDGMLLSLACLGQSGFESLRLVTQPPEAAVSRARELLVRLKALDEGGIITAHGRLLAQLPTSTRLAACLVRAKQLDVLPAMCRAAVLLAEPLRRPAVATSVGLTDLWPQLNPQTLDSHLAREAERLFEQARNVLRAVPAQTIRHKSDEARLAQAFLAGFADRLARRQGSLGICAGALPLAVAHWGPAQLAASSVVRDNLLLLVLAARPLSRDGLWEVTSAAGIEPEWLIDFDADGIEESVELVAHSGHKLQRRLRMRYAGIVVFEELVPVADAQVRSLHHLQAVLQSSATQLMGELALEQLSCRLALVLKRSEALRTELEGKHRAAEELTVQDCERYILTRLHHLASELFSDEMVVRPWPASLWRQALAAWPHRLTEALSRWTPETLQLGAKKVPIRYSRSKPPQCAAPLQLFFGRSQGPQIMEGQLALVLELLGPNGRPLQTTRDLQNFWQTHYPALRRQLSRRYPRHQWPEDPLAAVPQIHRSPTPKA